MVHCWYKYQIWNGCPLLNKNKNFHMSLFPSSKLNTLAGLIFWVLRRSYLLPVTYYLLLIISFYLIYVLHPLRKLYWRNHFHYFSNIFATYTLQQCFETVLKFSILTLQPFSSKMLEQHWFMSRYYKVITISDSPSRFSSDLQIITTTKDP